MDLKPDYGVTESESGSLSHSRASSSSPTDAVRATPKSFSENGCICRAQPGESAVPVENDETLLAIYVNELMPQYPFVTLPVDITAGELASSRPFLLAAIRMIASYRNIRVMRQQQYHIMKHLSEHMMMRSERSLEMLQVVLLLLGYYHYHCMMHAQMSHLAALAVSLAADLGINRSPEFSERTRLLNLHPEAIRPRSNEERRAMCGVWYMHSV